MIVDSCSDPHGISDLLTEGAHSSGGTEYATRTVAATAAATMDPLIPPPFLCFLFSYPVYAAH